MTPFPRPLFLHSHYRPRQRTIYIEKTKFNKDRLLPIPWVVAKEIDNYLAVRQCLVNLNPFLLAGTKNKGLSPNHIYPTFHRAIKEIGLTEPRRIIANTTFGSPTPHCLRHSFAINTLKNIKTRGKSPQNALPVLAAYMGHRKYRYTALYLKVLDAEQRQNLVDFTIAHQEEL